MSQARTVFLERLASFRKAVTQPYLMDTGATSSTGSSEPAILRNGLSVVGFAMLEDFLRQRVAEATSIIPMGAIPFPALPVRLQTLFTNDALAGLQFRLRLERKAGSDLIKFVQEHTGHIGSTAGSPYRLSPLGFGNRGSNLSVDDIPDLLKCFQIKKEGWDRINKVANLFGFGVLSCRDAFLAAAARRHKAAHNPLPAATVNDLINYGKEAVAIAIGFDLMLSQALIHLRAGDAKFCADAFDLVDGTIRIRVIDPRSPTKWAAKLIGKSRASKIDSKLDQLKKDSLKTAKRQKEALVVRDHSNMVIEWHTPAAEP